VGVLALVVGLGVGGGVAFFLARPPEPGFVASGGGVDWVEVTSRAFDDERNVQGRATLAEEWKALAPNGGVVRRTDCEVGAGFGSGATPFVIDDRPVVLLRLSTPVWRDMWPTMRGPDVKALQKELRKLGHKDVPTDGYFGSATSAAVKALWDKAGGDPKQNWVPADQVVWLPERTLTPATCPLKIGQRIAAGDVLFTVGGGLQAITIQLPQDAVDGPRVAVLDDIQAPISPDGLIDDPAFLARYTKTRSYFAFLEDPTSTLTVTTRLSEPLSVAAVPPSSLYDLVEGRGCVVDDAGPLLVEVVASQLGETFVTGERLPTRVLVDPGEAGMPCG